MRCLVLGVGGGDAALGILQKFRGQANALTEAGHDVEIQILESGRGQLIRDHARAINSFSGDVLLLRAGYWLHGAVPAIRRFKKRGGWVVVDLPTPIQATLRQTWDHDWYSLPVRVLETASLSALSLTLRSADRVICYAPDARFVERLLGDRPRYLGNSIDVGQVSVAKGPAADGPIRLVAVATFMPYHGYDRVLEGLKAIHTDDLGSDIQLTFVGEGPDLEALVDRTNALELEDAVTFTGPATGAALDSLMDGSDLAVGPLAVHRVGLREAAALKNRDYMARGIPVVYAGTDRDLNQARESGLCLQVSSDDAALDMAAIASWARQLRRTDTRSACRQYAEDHLDYSRLVDIVLPASEGW